MVLAAKAKHGDSDLSPWHRRIQRSLLTFSSFTASRLEQYNCPQCPKRVLSGQTIAAQNQPLSAMVQKRTKCCDAANVRYVPKADSCTAANSISIRSRR